MAQVDWGHDPDDGTAADDLDPTAPDRGGNSSTKVDTDPALLPSRDHEVDRDVDAQGGPEVLADGSLDDSIGFTDAQGIIRLWIDESGLINRVRLTGQWRTRLRTEDPQQVATELAGVVCQAFTMVNAALSLRSEADDAADHDLDPGHATADFTWEALADLEDQLDELETEALTGPDDRDIKPIIGRGSNGNVRVRLHPDGSYHGVHFDTAWLEASRVSDVNSGLEQASRDAFSQWTPSRVDQDPLERRSQELVRELDALMNGDRR